ncbi:hypothetical protein EV182_002309, partial [Spiromyces aspiralis]
MSERKQSWASVASQPPISDSDIIPNDKLVESVSKRIPQIDDESSSKVEGLRFQENRPDTVTVR